MNILMIGSIGMMGLGVFLMVARTFLPGTVVIVLGIIMTLYSQYNQFSQYSRNPAFKKVNTKVESSKVCLCSICNHKQSKYCIDSRCHCCIIVKEDIVVGHHNSPLQ